MGDIPDPGKFYSVRTPAWWDRAKEYVLSYYPGREEAQRRAGHDFTVIERPVLVQGFKSNHVAKDFKALVRTKAETADKALLSIVSKTYALIQGDFMYDFLEALIKAGFLYETGGTMGNGAICFTTLLLNEPIIIPGDNSQVLPYVVASWGHGTISASLRSTQVRTVCRNTLDLSEAEGKRLGTNFSFRHTKNVAQRMDEARETIKGARANITEYAKVMQELAAIKVTPAQRDLFVSEIIGDRGGMISKSSTVSDRVKNNIEAERTKILSTFMSETIPEAHALTGYGLMLAGTEYADHLRNYKTQDSYVKRTLLTSSPFKTSLNKTIREIALA